MKTNKMKIEIWSDIMCPFCYIGKRNFEAALEKFDDRKNLEIEWKSFQLDPTIPEDLPETNIYDYLSKRLNSNMEQTKARMTNVIEMAKNVGLDYNYDKAVVANSFKAHRLIQLAKTKGLGDAAEERLFKAYFTEGKNFGDTQILLELGKEIGLDADEIQNALTSDDIARKVSEDIQEAQQLGVTGVPFFVFDRKYGISGAQPVEAFLQTLDQSFTDWRKENPAPQLEIIEGPSCDVNGNCN
ncbi:MAG: DsbA family oxidoreductase [Flavobacterium sp.]